jgi:hypothetical protein
MYTYTDVYVIIRALNHVSIVLSNLEDLHDIQKHNRGKCGQSDIKWYVMRDNVAKPSCVFVLGSELSPPANTMALIPDDTDDT